MKNEFLYVYPDLSSLSQFSPSSEPGFSGPEFSWKVVFVYPCERRNKNICDLNLLLRCWEFEGVWWSELEGMQSLPVKMKMATETDIYSTFSYSSSLTFEDRAAISILLLFTADTKEFFSYTWIILLRQHCKSLLNLPHKGWTYWEQLFQQEGRWRWQQKHPQRYFSRLSSWFCLVLASQGSYPAQQQLERHEMRVNDFHFPSMCFVQRWNFLIVSCFLLPLLTSSVCLMVGRITTVGMVLSGICGASISSSLRLKWRKEFSPDSTYLWHYDIH